MVDARAVTGYGGVMAVTARSKKTPAAKKASPKTTNGNGHTVKDYEVITLRIDRQDKAKLLDHCAKRAKQQGKQMSFNRAIIEWIKGL